MSIIESILGKMGLSVAAGYEELRRLNARLTTLTDAVTDIPAIAGPAGETGATGATGPAGVVWSSWQPISLGSGWSSYGGTYHTPAYRYSSDTVEFRGMLQCSNWSASPLIATLPAAIRSTKDNNFLAVGNPSMTIVRIKVSPNGEMRFIASTNGNSNWIDLCGQSYSL